MDLIDEMLDINFTVVDGKVLSEQEVKRLKKEEDSVKVVETAYTANIKFAYTLMFGCSSQDSYEQSILKSVLVAPLKQEEPLNVTRYTLLDKEKKAKKLEAKAKEHSNQTDKMEKERLKMFEETTLEIVEPEINTPIVELTEVINTNPNLKVEKAQNKAPRMSITDIDNSVKATRNRKTKIDELKLEHTKRLFIPSRRKFVTQYKKKDGTVQYSRAKVGRTKVDRKLHDSEILKHIRQETTLAVFAGKYLTSFICFDVDSPDLEYSKKVAIDTKNILMNNFKIEAEYINISFSGGKGYHVELCFVDAIKNEDSKLLYSAVKQLLGPLKAGSDVEHRPTFKQAAKLAGSINRNTGALCCYVDNVTFEPILDDYHLSTIKQLSVEKISEILEITNLFTFESKKVEDIEDVMGGVNDNKFTAEDVEKQVVEVLNTGHLLRNGTRNNMTLKIASFLNSQGNIKADTLATLNAVMHNTWKNHILMFSQDDYNTLSEINEKTEKIVDTVYLKNYGIQTFDKEIEIFKSEMEAVISIKQGHLRHLLYSFILHSKKYAKKDGSFFFAYSTMSAMGNAKNRGSLLAYVTLLEEAGYVEIINRGTLNKALTKEYGRVMFDTNTYKLTLDKPSGFDPSIIINPTKKSANIYKNAKKLVDMKTIKENSSRDDWDNNYKKLFK